MVDRVQPIKTETAALGGNSTDEMPYYVPVEAQEDALEAAGLYLQDATHRDKTTLLYQNNNDLLLKDGNNTTPKSLTSMLTAAQHAALRQLDHLASHGPMEGFTTGAYREVLPAGNAFPTSVIWWESSAKLKKIAEKLITRNSSQMPTQVQWKAYDSSGSLLVTITDAITYTSNVFETTRTRSIA